MTETERRRVKAICEVAGVSEIDDLSDGFHTFRQLYYQRMMLFAAIVKQNKDKAWKSLRHEDGELCFGGGWFIVGIDTPEGSYTYHYEDSYFSLFDCEELERGKHWDGHTEKDVTRLLSLPSAQPEQIARDIATIIENEQDMRVILKNAEHTETHSCDCISREAAIHLIAGYNGVMDKSVAKRLLIQMPSAQPERKKGKWIDGSIPTYAVCSECAYQERYAYENNYCPNCGSDNRGEQE